MARSGADARDQRKTRRIEPYLAPCHIHVGRRRLSGYVTNLSTRGARVYTDEKAPRAGQAMVVEIRFRPRSAAHRLPAEVRWVRTASDITGLHSFGVSFRGLKPEERRSVESVLAEFRRRAEALLQVTG